MTTIKKIRWTAILCLFFACARASSAGILEFKTDGRHSFEINEEYYYLELNASDQIKAYGSMFGFGLSGTHKPSANTFIRPEFRFASGTADYNGPLAYFGDTVTKTGTIGDVETTLVEIKALFGYFIRSSRAASLIFYTGFGKKYFDMDLRNEVTYTSPNAGTRPTKIWLRYYEDEYIPLGLTYVKRLPNYWTFGATAQGDYIYTSSGYGLKGSMELQRHARLLNLALETYVNYWRFPEARRHTDSVDIQEPSMRILEYGIFVKQRF